MDACEDVDVSTLPVVDRDAMPAAGWLPPGPVSFDFVQSEALIRGLAGPYGSGKSSLLTNDGIIRAVRQPRQRDGVRRFRRCYIADNYRDLYKTLIRTHNEWLPKELGKWQGGQDRPARHDILLRDEYGLIEFTAEFVALGEHRAEDALDGYEPTDAVIDRASAVPRDAYRYIIGRVGRYPRQDKFFPGDGALRGVAMAFNKPDVNHWLYDVFVSNLSDNAMFFDQPGGRSPDAENIANLAAGYYDLMVSENEDWWVRRFVDNEWGFDRSGTPVYSDYSDHLHVSKTGLRPIPGIPIGIGLDGGGTLNPAAVIAQQSPEGQWRVLAELVPGRMGASRFAELLRDFLTSHFAGFEFYAYCDPSAFAGADQEGGERTWVQTLEMILRIPIQPAPSNEEAVRIDAVAQALRACVSGGGRGVLLDPVNCPVLRKGFNSGYQYRLQKVAGQEHPEPHPAKTGPAGAYSHPHDAFQYLVLGREGLHAVTARAGGGVGSSLAHESGMPSSGGWSPLDI